MTIQRAGRGGGGGRAKGGNSVTNFVCCWNSRSKHRIVYNFASCHNKQPDGGALGVRTELHCWRGSITAEVISIHWLLQLIRNYSADVLTQIYTANEPTKSIIMFAFKICFQQLTRINLGNFPWSRNRNHTLGNFSGSDLYKWKSPWNNSHANKYIRGPRCQGPAEFAPNLMYFVFIILSKLN